MISRREALQSALGATALSAASRQARAQNAAKPNVIVILTDDHGSGDLGCFGATDFKTPHFDALAKDGVCFRNWYSNAPVCAPSRASVITGKYPQRTGVSSNGGELTPSQPNIATALKASGYATAAIGKWHLGMQPGSLPNDQGFDYFYGFHYGCIDFYSHRNYWGEPRRVNLHDLWRNKTEVFEDGRYFTERITEEASAFIMHHHDEPFFLYLAYNGPHYPMHAPDKYTSRFPHLDWERRVYCAMISAIDDGIGELRALLQRLGLAENTLIVFAGDNGATTEKRAGLNQQPATAGRNRGFRGFKFSVFDGGMHVPAIVSWPARLPKGAASDEICMSMDILPTILEATGAKLPAGESIDGESILDVARSRAKSPHEAIFWNHAGQDGVRQGKWKLAVNAFEAGPTEQPRKRLTGDDAIFLSNLEADPGETTNLRRQHPEIVDQLQTKLAVWRERVGVDR